MGNGLISYATNEQDQITFNAKVLNAEGKEITQADITSELKLYLNIAVKEGTLKNIKLNLTNCNFELKDEFNLEQVNAGENKELTLTILAKKDEKYNLDLLNMENKIELTGTYTNNNKTEEVSKESKNLITWNAENLYTMDDETRKETKTLSTEIITNKTYTINKEEKRVVQVKVKSGIKDNIYPIEKTTITINPLEIGEMGENKEFIKEKEITAQEATVSAYSTKATNGKDGSVEFGTTEENKLGSWQYDSESGKTTITVNNNKDENNNVTWTKNAVDEFVITYIFEEENIKNAKALKTEAESTIKLYTDQEEHKKTTKYWETNAEKNTPIELEVQTSQELSKRNIATGIDFNEVLTLKISNEKIAENIVVESNLDKLNISNLENIKPSTTYKTTYLIKQEFINLLGEDGKIEVVDKTKQQTIGTITKESIDSENEELLCINYPEAVNQIELKLSKPVKSGKLKIGNVKNLNISNIEEYLTKTGEINLLKTSTIASIKQAQDAIYSTPEVLKEIALVEPKTSAELGINLGKDKTTLPVGEQNEVAFTVTLHTSKDTNKLFSNPKVQIELPAQISEVAIKENTQNILNANGLQLKNITTNNNIIDIELTGSQESYTEFNGQDTTITFTTSLKTSKLLPTFTQNIKLTVVNKEEKVEDTKQVIFSAEKGILLANSISNYNQEQPSISAFKNEEKTGLLNSALEQPVTATGKGTIINNTENKLENVEVIGKGNLKVALEGATVAYTKDQNVTAKSNWNITEYSQDVTGYKLIVPTIEKGSIKEFAYQLTIPANLGENKTIELQYSVISETKETISPKIILKTDATIEEPEETPKQDQEEEPNETPTENPEETQYKLDLALESSVPTTQTLQPGQEITYTITVKNTNEEHHRIILKGKMPKGIIVDNVNLTINEEQESIVVLSEQEYYKTLEVPANGVVKLIIKAHASKSINVTEVEVKTSAVIRLPNESGLLADEEKCYVGEVEKNIKHNSETGEKLTDIEIPEEITLKIGEKKQLEIKTIPENAPEESLKIEVANSSIATVTTDGLIEGIQKGTTTITVCTQDKRISKTCKINVIESTQNPSNPSNPTNPDTPTDPSTPSTPEEGVYSISGTAWFDENQDGIKDEKEKLLKGILVKIKQINKNNVAEYLTDVEGKTVTAITDNQGKYEFKNLEPGKYIIEFEYNTKTYKLTPIANKDSNPTASTTSAGTTVTTDTLSLVNKNIENINIGLVLNEKFDLELTKYITKVTVQNNSGTTEYKYNNEQLAKVEIKAKQIESSTILVEYIIEVKNNGAVPGTASVIVDYLPKELKFSSEMNTNWYQGTDGNIYTEELKNEILEPGETKQVKLVLTKALNSNGTGTFTNAAEIYEDKNDFGLVDTNSTPANQEPKENDYSTAELIVSIATGSPIMYIGIVITSIIILGGGIYLINKKVINRKNFI